MMVSTVYACEHGHNDGKQAIGGSEVGAWLIHGNRETSIRERA